MPSPLADRIPLLIREVKQAFLNEFHLRQPFRFTDVMPGERYGVLKFESYARDPDRPALALVRNGIEAKQLRFKIYIVIGFSAIGMTLEQAEEEAEILGIQEALAIEHGLSALKGEIGDQGIVYDVRNESTPIDFGASQLREEPTTWNVNITADGVLNLMVRRDRDGLHHHNLLSDL